MFKSLWQKNDILSTSTASTTSERHEMLCTRCLRGAITRRQVPALRQFSTSIAIRAAEPKLSTPTTQPGEAPAPTATARSICPAGTSLGGLNYTKGREDPLAKNDEEYPEWLWSCLDVMKKSADGTSEEIGDEFCTLHCWPVFPDSHLHPNPVFLAAFSY